MTQSTESKKHGFNTMTPERQKEISSMGGKAAHAAGKAHEFTPEEARIAGAKGGRIHGSEHMAEIGRKGGASVSQNREHMQAIGRKGGAAVSKDREHMREIGRRGGKRISSNASSV